MTAPALVPPLRCAHCNELIRWDDVFGWLHEDATDGESFHHRAEPWLSDVQVPPPCDLSEPPVAYLVDVIRRVDLADALDPNGLLAREIRLIVAVYFGSSKCDPDCSWSGVDQTDLNDPEKVWRCDGCGEEGTSEALRLSHGGSDD